MSSSYSRGVSASSSPRDRDDAPRRVEEDRPVAQDAARVAGRLAGPPQERRDPRPHLADPERLGHVVVRAGLEGGDLVRLLAARGEDEDRGRGLAPDVADDGQAVAVREAEVEQDEVGPVGIPGAQPGTGVSRLLDVVVVRGAGSRRPRSG